MTCIVLFPQEPREKTSETVISEYKWKLSYYIWAFKDQPLSNKRHYEQLRSFVRLSVVLQKQPRSLSSHSPVTSPSPVLMWLCGWTPAQHSKIVGQLEASDLFKGRRTRPWFGPVRSGITLLNRPVSGLACLLFHEMCLWNSANLTETDWTLLDNSAAFVWNCQSWPFPDGPPFLLCLSCEQTKQAPRPCASTQPAMLECLSITRSVGIFVSMWFYFTLGSENASRALLRIPTRSLFCGQIECCRNDVFL